MAKKSKCDNLKKQSTEKINPFDLRFNKIKHKIVNQKLRSCEYGSNTYKSRKRDNEIRRKELLTEYEKRNKIGKITVKNNLKNVPTNILKNNENQTKSLHQKRKSNAEYMSEIFKKKNLILIEQEKLHDLKDEVDSKWKKLKEKILPQNGLNKTSIHNVKIDSYDSIFNDLLVNKGEKYIPNDIARSELKKKTLNKVSQSSSIIAFEESIEQLKNNNNFNEVKIVLEKLLNFTKIKIGMFDYLKLALIDINFNTNILNSISILSLCSTIPNLKNAIFFKLAELFKMSSYNSIGNIINLIIYSNYFLKITDHSYSPELIKNIQNILILFLKRNEFDKFFLPTYKLGKNENRHFLNFNSEESYDVDSYCLTIEFVSSQNFKSLNDNMKRSLILKEILNLIIVSYQRYCNFEAYYPKMEKNFKNVLEITNSTKAIKELTLPMQKPRILPLIEPNFDFDDFTPKHVDYKTREKILSKKLKREMKSAKRELKKDAAFLSQIKLKETMEKDKVRKEKVKQLISEINTDRSLFKK